jgi:phage baseplate assembly protein W
MPRDIVGIAGQIRRTPAPLPFLNPTSSRTRTVPGWFGPVLPQSPKQGTPITVYDPNAVSDIQQPGAVFPSSSSYKAALLSDLQMLLSTRPGERIFLPRYGLNLEAYIFEMQDESLQSQIQGQLKTQIESFLPVTVTNIDITTDPTGNQVNFSVVMQIRGSTPNDVLTYSIALTPPV